MTGRYKENLERYKKEIIENGENCLTDLVASGDIANDKLRAANQALKDYDATQSQAAQNRQEQRKEKSLKFAQEANNLRR